MSVMFLHLFQVMERVPPIDPMEWKMVLKGHSKNYPRRDIESLRHKYTPAHQKTIPTDDLNMPDAVRLVKLFKYLIGHKAELRDAMGQFDMDNEGESEEEEVVETKILEVPFPDIGMLEPHLEPFLPVLSVVNLPTVDAEGDNVVDVGVIYVATIVSSTHRGNRSLAVQG